MKKTLGVKRSHQRNNSGCEQAVFNIYLAPGGGCEVLFSPGLSVCVSMCLCVCISVCPANILIFYFSATRRDIDLKLIQYTNRIDLDSLKKIDIHMSKVKVTGTVHCFLKVQSYHKNWAIEFFFHRHLLGYFIRWNNKNWSEQRNDVTKNTSIFDFNM